MKALSTHHVIPRSRCKEFKLDPNDNSNKTKVDPNLHDLYHRLFSNMTPKEIIVYLSKTFWRGQIPPLGV